MQYWLVMPAAGAGRRFGGVQPKQHTPLAAGTLLECALQPFVADVRCRGGVLVMAPDDAQRAALRRRLPATLQIVDGGAERAHSVFNGLKALASQAAPGDWVLVHDAARPCLSGADLDRLCTILAQHAVGGLLAAPVADTVKRADTGGGADAAAAPDCVATVAREALWLAQTPQMFRYEPLRRALQQALERGQLPTDEAQAMEWQGLRPGLVAAQDSNIKVTRGADLALAAAILEARLE